MERNDRLAAFVDGYRWRLPVKISAMIRPYISAVATMAIMVRVALIAMMSMSLPPYAGMAFQLFVSADHESLRRSTPVRRNCMAYSKICANY